MQLIVKRTAVWIWVLTITLLLIGVYGWDTAAAAPISGVDAEILTAPSSDGRPVVYTWEPKTGAGFAILYGTLEEEGEAEVEYYGFYVGSPGYEDDEVKIEFEGELDRNDLFQYRLNGLEDGVVYYVKAFAENDEGTGYGQLHHFDVDKVDKVSIFTVGSSVYNLWGAEKQMDTSPYLKNARTYMPVRYAAYAMGLTDADITWDEAAQTVMLSKSGSQVRMTIGSYNLWVNGIPTPMDVVPEIHEGRACLPIAWVAQAFRHNAVWNPSAQTITIQSK